MHDSKTPFINSSVTVSNTITNIDELFKRIGFSVYHKKLICVLILIFLADGVELMCLNLILKSLELEWNISKLDKSIITSSVYIGIFLGTFLSSYFTDRLGRKRIIFYSVFLVIIFGILSCLSNKVYQLFFCRLFLGVGVGGEINSAVNLAVESIHPSISANFTPYIFVGMPVGEIYISLIAYWIMPNYETGKWKTLLVYAFLPSVLTLIGLYFIHESPKFHMAHKNYDKAFSVFEDMARQAKLDIKEIDFYSLKLENEKNKTNELEISYNVLFTEKYRRITLSACAIFLVMNLAYYGTSYVLPQMLNYINNLKGIDHSANNPFLNYAKSSLFSVPMSFIAGLLSNHPKLGRKYSIVLCFVILIFICLLNIIFIKLTYVLSGCIKLFGLVAYQVSKLWVNESYPTKIRGIGFGFTDSFGRFCCILFPFYLEFLITKFDLIVPYINLMIFCFLGGIVAYSLPFDTLGRKLDVEIELETK